MVKGERFTSHFKQFIALNHIFDADFEEWKNDHDGKGSK